MSLITVLHRPGHDVALRHSSQCAVSTAWLRVRVYCLVRFHAAVRAQSAHLRSMMLSLSSEAGGGGFAMLAMTRRIIGCMLVGAAAAAADSTCSDLPLSSAPSCAHRGTVSPTAVPGVRWRSFASSCKRCLGGQGGPCVLVDGSDLAQRPVCMVPCDWGSLSLPGWHGLHWKGVTAVITGVCFLEVGRQSRGSEHGPCLGLGLQPAEVVGVDPQGDDVDDDQQRQHQVEADAHRQGRLQRHLQPAQQQG